MTSKIGLVNSLLKIRNLSSTRRSFTAGKVIYSKKQNVESIKNVTGLSKAVLTIPKENVGPGASKNSNYKNPEYFCYHTTSYFEAEIEMLKYRMPQPSSK